MRGQDQSQEQIRDSVLAELADDRILPDDIPPDDEIYGWPDPDCGPPAELEALTDAEFEELLAAAPVRPSRYVEPSWPVPGTFGQPGRSDRGRGPGQPDGPFEPSGWADTYPAGWLPRDASGGGCGFADGGALDVLAAGLPLAGFAEDAHDALTQITDDELIGLIAAWRRLSSWASARELAAVAELARRRPEDGTPPAAPGGLPYQLSEFIPDEVAAALTLTRVAAQAETGLALELAGVLRATGAALESGRIDLPKAKILSDGTGGLPAAHAAAVEAAVLPDAPGMTTAQLRRAVAAAILAVDPDAARQQREEAVRHARVDCWPDPVGTATLAGYNLPAAEALAADRRLCLIARAWKKMGAAGGIGSAARLGLSHPAARP